MIQVYFGKKGSGKTTYLSYIANSKKYRRLYPGGIYCNVPILNTKLYNPSDLGKFEFPENSLILLDEAGIAFSNMAGVKSTAITLDQLYWWKYSRHYKNDVIIVSQVHSDFLVQLRNLADDYFLMERGFLGFTIIKSISKDIMVDENSHQIIDGYFLDKGFKLFFRPLYYKYFDTFERITLPTYLSYYKISDPLPDSSPEEAS